MFHCISQSTLSYLFSVQFVYTKVNIECYTLQIHFLLCIYVCTNRICLCLWVTTDSAVSSTGQDPQVMDFTVQLQATTLTLVHG